MRVLAFALLTLAVLTRAHAGSVTLFDANPSHPWNRLYAAMYIDEPGEVSLEPRPLAEWSKHDERLTGGKYAELLAALDGFLTRRAEKLSTSAVDRALLQSAVWATFDQVSDPRGIERAARMEVARRCAEILRRLALDSAEIARLPDNYAAQLKLTTTATEYDPANPTRAFLPEDLLDPNGPWVMLLSNGEFTPAAIQHVQAVQGRAVFHVFIRFPAGNAATLEYLRSLASFAKPLVWNDRYAAYPYATSPVQPNPELPELPEGTQVALMRRMMLIDSRGELVATPVTQSLQLRVYAKDPARVAPGDLDNQKFFEWRLSAGELLANRGGLVAQVRRRSDPLMTFEEPTIFLRGSCGDCHGGVGIHSVLTYSNPFGPRRATPWFEPTTREEQDRVTMAWKKRSFSWGLLQGYWDPPRPRTIPRAP